MIRTRKHRVQFAGVFAAYFGLSLFLLAPIQLLNNADHIAVIPIAIFAAMMLSFIAMNLIRSFKPTGQKIALILVLEIVSLLIALALQGIFGIHAEALLYLLIFALVGLVPGLMGVFLLLLIETKNRIQPLHVESKSAAEEVGEVHYFVLKNAKGRIKFKERLEDILCFESDNNYVIVHYRPEEEPTQRSVLRLTLKKVEHELIRLGSKSFYRVHRSFLVNIDHIEKVQGKSQSYKLQLKFFEQFVPVSRSFDISRLD